MSQNGGVNFLLLSKELRSCELSQVWQVSLHELGTVGLGIGTSWNSFPPCKSGVLIWIRKYQIEKLKFHPFATPPQCRCRLWRHFLIPATVPKFHRRKESHPMDCDTKKAEEKARMSPYCLRGNNFSYAAPFDLKKAMLTPCL